MTKLFSSFSISNLIPKLQAVSLCLIHLRKKLTKNYVLFVWTSSGLFYFSNIYKKAKLILIFCVRQSPLTFHWSLPKYCVYVTPGPILAMEFTSCTNPNFTSSKSENCFKFSGVNSYIQFSTHHLLMERLRN
jgi:hypothetical protein